MDLADKDSVFAKQKQSVNPVAMHVELNALTAGRWDIDGRHPRDRTVHGVDLRRAAPDIDEGLHGRAGSGVDQGDGLCLVMAGGVIGVGDRGIGAKDRLTLCRVDDACQRAQIDSRSGVAVALVGCDGKIGNVGHL